MVGSSSPLGGQISDHGFIDNRSYLCYLLYVNETIVYNDSDVLTDTYSPSPHHSLEASILKGSIESCFEGCGLSGTVWQLCVPTVSLISRVILYSPAFSISLHCETNNLSTLRLPPPPLHLLSSS